MNYITEPTKSYADLDTLRQDLALMDVRETKVFTLNQMQLTPKGTVQVNGLGEFPLSEIALGDAIRRGGLQVSCCQNFFQENNEALNEAIVHAINSFYKHSRFASSEIKLVTRLGVDKEPVVQGIPSKRYALFTHSQAIAKIIPTISGDFRLTRANLYAPFLEIAFTNPLHAVKDRVGKVVLLGLQFMNSEGTRKCALIGSAFVYRVVCANGSIARQTHFSTRYVHKGDMHSPNGRFAENTKEIFERFSLMMKSLPRLGSILVNERLISMIRPTLIETLKTKGAEAFLAAIDKTETVDDVWNKVTHLPHQISNPEHKIKLENLGFKILTQFLSYN